METLFVGLRETQSFLFLLNAAHQLLRLFVLAGHDVAHTEVGQHDCGHVQQTICEALHNRVVVTNRVLELGLLHEEHMRDVELPHLVLGAELCALEEELLHHRIVVALPVDASLGHQHRNVLLQLVVVQFQTRFDQLVVTGQAGVLDLLGEATQLFDVLGRQLVELAVGLLHRGGHHDTSIQVIILLLGEVFVRKVGVLRQQARGDVVVLVLAVQQQQIAKGLRRVRRVGQQIRELLERGGRFLLAEDNCLSN